MTKNNNIFIDNRMKMMEKIKRIKNIKTKQTKISPLETCRCCCFQKQNFHSFIRMLLTIKMDGWMDNVGWVIGEVYKAG